MSRFTLFRWLPSVQMRFPTAREPISRTANRYRWSMVGRFSSTRWENAAMKQGLGALVALGLFLGLAGQAAAQVQQYQYTPFNVIGATQTEATGINDAGQIVGWYIDAGDILHGFLLSNSIYT